MLYEVWEGQCWLNNMDAPAGPTFKGKFEANSLKEACKIAYEHDPHFDEDKLTSWGIVLYDNEKDAHDLEKCIS
jgi:hypothetical protein